MVFVESALSYWSLVNNGGFLEASWGLPSIYIEPIVVSPNFEITVECGLKFHWYLRTLSLKFRNATTQIEIFWSLPC
jgi:hypothetical protein